MDDREYVWVVCVDCSFDHGRELGGIGADVVGPAWYAGGWRGEGIDAECWVGAVDVEHFWTREDDLESALLSALSSGVVDGEVKLDLCGCL